MACQPSYNTNKSGRRAPASACSATSACATPVRSLSKRQRQQRRRGRTTSSAYSTTIAIKIQNATRRRFGVLCARKHDVNVAPGCTVVTSTTATKKIKAKRIPVMKARPAPLALGLPQRLPRPPRREVSQEALVAADPSLEGVAPQYARELLTQLAPSMLMGMADIRVVRTSTPVKGAQAQLGVIMPNTSAIAPSHMLAIYPSTPSSPAKTAPIQSVAPIHSIVLAAHCANLPPMASTSSAPSPSSPQQPIALPLQPLGLPSPSTFPALSGYLYHKRTETLLNQILPTPAPVGFELHRIAEFGQSLARECGRERVMESMNTVKGVWANSCVLGVIDDSLWDTLDLAWEVLCVAHRECESAVSC